jgi:hypothetical protein
MPLVAAGRTPWSAGERAHLASCGECAAEWKLVSEASMLGRSISVDPPILTSAVLGRVREARQGDRQRRWMARSAQVAGLAVAALVLLTIVPRWREAAPVQPPPGAATRDEAGLPLAELDGAEPSELEAVLVEFDAPGLAGSSLDGPDMEGLNMSQVERALRAWEES